MKFLKCVYYEEFGDSKKNVDIFYNTDKISRISYEKEKKMICIKLDNGEYELFVLDENLKIQLEKMGIDLNERKL